MVLIAYAWSMPAYARAHLCVPRFIRISNSLSYLECDFLTKAFLMTSMAYGITQDRFKLRFSRIKEKKKRKSKMDTYPKFP